MTARDIQRPVVAVYRKMMREYDVTNFVGRWSKHQEEKLLRWAAKMACEYDACVMSALIQTM